MSNCQNFVPGHIVRASTCSEPELHTYTFSRNLVPAISESKRCTLGAHKIFDFVSANLLGTGMEFRYRKTFGSSASEPTKGPLLLCKSDSPVVLNRAEQEGSHTFASLTFAHKIEDFVCESVRNYVPGLSEQPKKGIRKKNIFYFIK